MENIYKGQRVSRISELTNRRYGNIGKQYLRWVSNNVGIEIVVLKEAVEFYEDYIYVSGDGHDW